MPLILPHPITPTLTAEFSLMVAPFSRSAFQLVSTSPGFARRLVSTRSVGRWSAFQLVSLSRAQVLADMLRRRRSRRRRIARTSYGFLSGDLLHGDLAVFEGRGVAGVYNASPVQAVLPVLAFPGAFPDGLDEAPDNGVVSFARFDLGRYDGGHAGHVGVDTDGVAGAVVPYFHLCSTVGTVQGDAEVVARLAVDGPAGLQVQRRPSGEADEGGRQVLDFVCSVVLHALEVAPAAPPAWAELGVGGAAHSLYLGL